MRIQSANIRLCVQGLSATLAFAVYGVKWDCQDRRQFVVRCTLALPEQTQIEVGGVALHG